MTSYQFTQEHNYQSVLWAIGGAIHQTPATLTRLSVWASLVAQPFVNDACTLLAGLLTVLAYVLGIVAVVGALALLLANPVVLLTGLGIAAYAWVTFPRAKVR